MTWKLGNGLSRIGASTVLPSVFTARLEFPDDHTVELDISIEKVERDGRPHELPVCDAIRVERNPSRPPLTGDELRRFPLAHWVEFSCTQAAMRSETSDGVTTMTPITTDADAEAAEAAVRGTRRRRRITDELLRDVATVYLHAGEDAGVVSDRFHVSQAQAFRYVRMARERGLLPAKEG